jgi:hypothetical protein
LLTRIGDVARGARGLPPRLLYPGHDLLGTRLLEVVDDDAFPFSGELLCDGAAYAAAGARDE